QTSPSQPYTSSSLTSICQLQNVFPDSPPILWIPIFKHMQVRLNSAFYAVIAPLFGSQIRDGRPWSPPIFEPGAVNAASHLLAQAKGGLFGFQHSQEGHVLRKVALNLQSNTWDGTVDPESLPGIHQASLFPF